MTILKFHISPLKFVCLLKSRQTFLLYILLLLTSCLSKAQVNANFDAFPIDVQLYQRDNANKSIVDIKGTIYSQGYENVSLIVKKDKKAYIYRKQKLTYQTGASSNALFSFNPEIAAGLIEYDFAVYVIKGKDSVLVKEANNILCGDNILIYGQSNALASDVEELVKFTDELRYGRATFANFESGDYSWFVPAKWNHYLTGLVGLEIQKQLINQYKIPIGILNSAIGNTKIDELMIRDEKNHENTQYYYGQFLKKANKVGFGKTARILVWRQGENEAFEKNNVDAYPGKFDTFRKQIKEDFPSVSKIYVLQNNIYWGDNPKAGNLRDFQRRISQIYPDCIGLATIGTTTFDGLHYKYEGYQQTGQEVSRLIARDFISSKDTLEISSPNIAKAYFNERKDELVLEFDKAQQMRYPTETILKYTGEKAELKDYIYLDGKAGKIISGSQMDNKIILKLSEPSSAKLVTYGPDNFIPNSESLLGIPYLKNSRGVRAFTFKDFSITSNIQVAPTVLSGTWNGSILKRIFLEWPIQNGVTYTIEKSVNSPQNFLEVATITGNQYIDLKVKKGVKYYYRLKINGETYSNIIEIFVPLNDTQAIVNDNAILAYPNPVSKGMELTIIPQFSEGVEEVRLSNSQGNIVQQLSNKNGNILIQTEKLNTGIYFIEAISTDKKKVTKKIIIE